MITQERLKELIKYEPESGEAVWVVNGTRSRVGKVAGDVDRQGYRRIKERGIRN